METVIRETVASLTFSEAVSRVSGARVSVMFATRILIETECRKGNHNTCIVGQLKVNQDYLRCCCYVGYQ